MKKIITPLAVLLLISGCASSSREEDASRDYYAHYHKKAEDEDSTGAKIIRGTGLVLHGMAQGLGNASQQQSQRSFNCTSTRLGEFIQTECN